MDEQFGVTPDLKYQYYVNSVYLKAKGERRFYPSLDMIFTTNIALYPKTQADLLINTGYLDFKKYTYNTVGDN